MCGLNIYFHILAVTSEHCEYHEMSYSQTVDISSSYHVLNRIRLISHHPGFRAPPRARSPLPRLPGPLQLQPLRPATTATRGEKTMPIQQIVRLAFRHNF
jgi:hypothetical protein